MDYDGQASRPMTPEQLAQRKAQLAHPVVPTITDRRIPVVVLEPR